MDVALLLSGVSLPIIGLVGFVALRRRGGSNSDAGPRRGAHSIGVQVVCDPTAGCSAATGVNGHIFPGDSPPRLPLPGCKKRKCKCRLQTAYERRRLDRRQASGVLDHDAPPQELRARRGRRREDRLWHDVS